MEKTFQTIEFCQECGQINKVDEMPAVCACVLEDWEKSDKEFWESVADRYNPYEECFHCKGSGCPSCRPRDFLPRDLKAI